MSANPPSVSRRTAWWQWAIASAIASACIASRIIKHMISGDTFFWDYWVYQGTMRAIRAGQDPYLLGTIQRFGVEEGYNFTYPPIAFHALQGLSAFSDRWVLMGYAMLFGASVLVSLHALVGTLFKNAPFFDRACAVLAAFATFTMAGTIMVSSANVGVMLNCMILMGLAWSLKGKACWPYYAAVLLGALIKPFYLEFLIVPFLVGRPFDKSAISLILVTTLCAAVYGLFFQFDGDAFRQWVNSLTDQSLSKGVAGDNIFDLARSVWGTGIALTAQALFSLALIAIAGTMRTAAMPLRLSAALIAAAFANPRIMMYDVFVAAVPIFCLLQALIARRLRLDHKSASLAAVSFLFVIGLLSLRGNPLVPRSVAFPLIALLSLSAACLLLPGRLDLRAYLNMTKRRV